MPNILSRRPFQSLTVYSRLPVRSPLPFLFIDLRVASPATPVFSQSPALPGCRGQRKPQFNRVTRHHSQVTCFHGTAASLPSVCSKSHPRFLCFQQLTDSFCKYRGWGLRFPQAPWQKFSLSGAKMIDQLTHADRVFVCCHSLIRRNERRLVHPEDRAGTVHPARNRRATRHFSSALAGGRPSLGGCSRFR